MRPEDPQPKTNETPDPPSALRDLVIPRRRMDMWGIGFFIALGLLLGTGAAVLAAWGFPQLVTQVVWPFVLIVALWVLSGARGAWTNACIDRFAKDAPESPEEFEHALIDCLRRTVTLVGFVSGWPFDSRSAPEMVARVLAQRGAFGKVYRIAADAKMFPEPPAPINVPFEPIALSPLDPALKALRQGHEQPAETPKESGLKRYLHSLGPSPWARALMLFGLAGMIIGILMILYDLIVSLIMLRMPMVALSLLPWAALILCGYLWYLWRPRKWFIVPGAIVVGTSRWRTAHWNLNMFPREDSVLVYWVHYNRIAIASRDGLSFSRAINRMPAEMAIRAWLSPLEPPPLERFSDLT
jgi:hypothetical protein